jgi:hypothetical protein
MTPGRAPRWARVAAPLLSFVGAICLFFALDIGPPRPVEGAGLRYEPQTTIDGRPAVVLHAARPTLHALGWTLLTASALLWLWDAATSE